MTSGGSSRNNGGRGAVDDDALSRAAGTTGAASHVSSRPQITSRSPNLVDEGLRGSDGLETLFQMGADASDVCEQASIDQFVEH